MVSPLWFFGSNLGVLHTLCVSHAHHTRLLYRLHLYPPWELPTSLHIRCHHFLPTHVSGPLHYSSHFCHERSRIGQGLGWDEEGISVVEGTYLAHERPWVPSLGLQNIKIKHLNGSMTVDTEPLTDFSGSLRKYYTIILAAAPISPWTSSFSTHLKTRLCSPFQTGHLKSVHVPLGHSSLHSH